MALSLNALQRFGRRWSGRAQPGGTSRVRRNTPGAWQPSFPRRIVLYSHDTQGLGHMRRNLMLAKALLACEPQPAILLIGGAREMGKLVFPPGIDCLTLPALGKCSDGQYRPRWIPISLRRLIALRTQTIASAIAAFDPDVLIVDKVPLGAFKELKPSLQLLRERGKARCILGLREVLDDPATTRREWRDADNDVVIGDYYDSIWVYGDPAVYNPVREYDFSRAVAQKVVFTGYLDRSAGASANDAAGTRLLEQLDVPPNSRLALCLVGGGQDGDAVAAAFAEAKLPADMIGVIVTGPFMSPDAQRRLHENAASNPSLRVLPFIAETAPLLRRAACVVCLGGYNTMCEVLAFEKPALVVPRVKPRREQLIRAERLRDLGLVDLLHPRDLTTEAISDWLCTPTPAPANVRERVDLNCLSRLPELLQALFVATQRPIEADYAHA